MAIYPQVHELLVNAAKNGTRDLLAAQGAGTSIWVHAVHCGTDADGTAIFIDSTPTNRSGVLPLLVAGQHQINWDFCGVTQAYIKCAANTKLQVTLSANSDLDGIILYSVQAS